MADLNLVKSPHSPRMAAMVLSETPGIDLRFSIGASNSLDIPDLIKVSIFASITALTNYINEHQA